MQSTGIGVLILRLALLAIVCRLVSVSSAKSRTKASSVVDATCTSQTCSRSTPTVAMTLPSRGGSLDSNEVDRGDTGVENLDADIISASILPTSGASNFTGPAALTISANTSGAEGLEDDSDERLLLNHGAKRRRQFLNRIARVSTNLLRRERDARLEEEEEEDATANLSGTGAADWIESGAFADEVTPQSDLSRPGRHIHIVTTASLPWMTGTSVNPLLRAAYLHERLQRINAGTHVAASANSTQVAPETYILNTTNTTRRSYVTLVIPWLELEEDQRQVYNGRVFANPEEQELYVRDWLRNQAGMPEAADNLNLVFYTARYHAELGSVFAMGDIIQQMPQDELDVCVLEEPEHVNWFRAPGQGWTKRYNYVVGVVHTNYDQYATQHYSGLWTAPAIRLMSAAMIRAYCHKVIKLSDVVQVFAPEKEITTNVHGVRQEFIVTERPASDTQGATETGWERQHGDKSETQIYFIGKLLWTKGLDIMLDFEEYYKQVTGEYFPIDIYGSGPDQEEITRAFLGRKIQEKDVNTASQMMEKASRNLFAKFFAWFNRRRKRKTSKKSSTTVSVEDLYKDVLGVFESFPSNPQESLENGTTHAYEAPGDITSAQTRRKKLPARARRALNRLREDLSRAPIPRTFHELRRQPIPASFPGRVDHASLKDSYKIFVNPSVSEVLCTTTAEALAMGKFAIIPVHPSNSFFLKFPNCLAYRNQYEFVTNLQWALTHNPVPLTEELAHDFSWEAATDRFLRASSITHREAREREALGLTKMDERIAWFHNELGKGVKGDIIRRAFGAGPVSWQVKYESKKNREGVEYDIEEDEIDEEEEIDEAEDDEEGLSLKFRDSALVRALREAFENGYSSAME